MKLLSSIIFTNTVILFHCIVITAILISRNLVNSTRNRGIRRLHQREEHEIGGNSQILMNFNQIRIKFTPGHNKILGMVYVHIQPFYQQTIGNIQHFSSSEHQMVVNSNTFSNTREHLYWNGLHIFLNLLQKLAILYHRIFTSKITHFHYISFSFTNFLPMLVL